MLEILKHKISYEFTSFSIFCLTQKSAKKKYYKFQRHSLWLRSIKKESAHTHKVFFGFGFCALLAWSIGLMKSKIVRVKSFSNYLNHHLPPVIEFSIFLDTLMYINNYQKSMSYFQVTSQFYGRFSMYLLNCKLQSLSSS